MSISLRWYFYVTVQQQAQNCKLISRSLKRNFTLVPSQSRTTHLIECRTSRRRTYDRALALCILSLHQMSSTPVPYGSCMVLVKKRLLLGIAHRNTISLTAPVISLRYYYKQRYTKSKHKDVRLQT